jgi:poly-gamma-glutamate synthesis protein (capsule biosynthesis protein)
VNLLPTLSRQDVARVAQQVKAARRPGDVAIASIHWGSNWGYEISAEEIGFAHALIDEAGVDVVHGHSSHHPRPIEVYRGKLILYGCGDFLNDYEGIAGYESYRGDLVLMYFPAVDVTTGRLSTLTLVPLQVRRFRLNFAAANDAAWLRHTLTREGRRFGTRLEPQADGSLALAWG